MITSPSRRGLVLLALVAAALVVAGCTTPLPPIAGPGVPLTGINPEVATTPGTRTTVVSYGPWTVPAATGPGHDGAGMIENQVLVGARKPCSDCYITTFKPELRYLDGSVANTDTGLWLHHFQLYVLGRTDPSCAAPYPYNLLGEHIFGGGNERTRARFPANAGVKVGALDSWVLIYDLMNTSDQARPVVLELTYEWVPASTPNMHGARALYLDVSPRCVESRVPAGTGDYEVRRTFPAPLSGRIVGLAGHLHDGGKDLVLRKAGGDLICRGVAGYGGPGFEEAGGHGGHDDHGSADPVLHVSSVGQCVSPSIDRPLGSLTKGEPLEIVASYGTPPGAPHQHVETTVMGVFFMYVLEEPPPPAT